MIRNGNHFVFMDGKGWVLIQGDWHDYLEMISAGAWLCKLSALGEEFLNASVRPIRSYDTPKYVEVTDIVWEKVVWHPGRFTPTQSWKSDFYYKEQEWDRQRIRYGWRVLPDGKVPIQVNRLTVSDPSYIELYQLA